MRLDRFLSEMKIGTRSVLKKEIRRGAVTIDGAVVKDPSTSVTPNSTVTYNGKPVSFVEFQYYILNKPAGVVTATEDKRHETVCDLLPEGARRDIFPVGRLDIDTEGLILLTNNGSLAHKMLAPKSHVDKKYYARIRGEVTSADVEAFRTGFQYDEDLYSLPADLEILGSGPGTTEVYVTIHEGKFHQIKKMFLARGMEVSYLKRVTFGPLSLPEELSQGDCRELSEIEISLLKEYM